MAAPQVADFRWRAPGGAHESRVCNGLHEPGRGCAPRFSRCREVCGLHSRHSGVGPSVAETRPGNCVQLEAHDHPGRAPGRFRSSANLHALRRKGPDPALSRQALISWSQPLPDAPPRCHSREDQERRARRRSRRQLVRRPSTCGNGSRGKPAHLRGDRPLAEPRPEGPCCSVFAFPPEQHGGNISALVCSTVLGAAS